MNKTKANRNGMIELLRFFFCMGVLMFHGVKYLFGEPSLKTSFHFEPFIHGALGVEFFFIVSGLFMAAGIKKAIEREKEKQVELDMPKEEFEFMKKKVKSIFPQHVIAFILIFIVTVLTTNTSVRENLLLLFNSIPNFFLLDTSGIRVQCLNFVEWYLSVMLIVMAIIYPFAKKYYNNFVKIICPIGALLILGFLQARYHSLTGVWIWTGICYKSMLRGLAEIMLGMFLYEVGSSLSKKEITVNKKKLLTIIEVACYLACFVIIMFTFAKKYEIYIVLLLAVAIPLSFSSITYTEKIKGNFFDYLGKLTLPLYLTQLATIGIVGYVFGNLSHVSQLLILFLLSIIVSMLALKLEELIKKISMKKTTS